ncbi:hypothetical protein WYO_3725 [Methylobacterium sp. GXF4]|nr:hypothetical protein WYO_3725 [Methylobacterium sp. GXF4]
MQIGAVFAIAILAGMVEFACLCHEAPVSSDE